MSIPPPQDEASRIKAIYSRRDATITHERYSIFKEHNLLPHLDLQAELIRLFTRFAISFEAEKILEVGCGRGYWLRQLIQWGAVPRNLAGVDLMQTRIDDAKALCPQEVTLQCADATSLDFEEAKFDMVLQFTVFTSVLDDAVKLKIASEMNRVLKPGGRVLWYDYFVSNPRNPDVRGVNRREIVKLFPGFSVYLKRVTLAPPITKVVAPVSSTLYRALSGFPFLRTHYLGILQKQ